MQCAWYLTAGMQSGLCNISLAATVFFHQTLVTESRPRQHSTCFFLIITEICLLNWHQTVISSEGFGIQGKTNSSIWEKVAFSLSQIEPTFYQSMHLVKAGRWEEVQNGEPSRQPPSQPRLPAGQPLQPSPGPLPGPRPLPRWEQQASAIFLLASLSSHHLAL